MDTIFALATAQGKAGVAVIRISGPDALDVGTKIAGSLPPARKSGVRELTRDSGEVLDHALVLRFDAPHSFTGEDVVEFQCHGSTAVIAGLLSELSAQPGTRLADPGEFTRRAMSNERLDLTQVEGLADLIDAETEAQRQQAQRTLSGALGNLAARWRTDLIRAAALLEATIDFADEEVPTDVTGEVVGLLEQVQAEISGQVSGVMIAERLRNGFEVAIVGAPNVGKSTLLNYLAGRDAAITSEVAGTTRDVIEVRMDLGGLPVTLLDTAGLRDTDDFVEGIGIERAMDRAQAADLRVFLQNADTLPLLPQADDIVVTAKADKTGDSENGISGVTGQGVGALIDGITAVLAKRVASAGLATRERHRHAMTSAADVLSSGLQTVVLGPEHYDIAAEDIRTAIRALESLVGQIGVENLLDEIFASFCVGK